MQDINQKNIKPLRKRLIRTQVWQEQEQTDDQEDLIGEGGTSTSNISEYPKNIDDDSEGEKTVVDELDPLTEAGRRTGKVIGLLSKGSYNIVDCSYESLNYEKSSCIARLEAATEQSTKFIERCTIWAIMVIIGFMTGITAFFIMFSIEEITKYKYYLITSSFRTISLDRSNGSHFSTIIPSISLAVSLNVILGSVAGTLGVLCAVSCGSGIPHIKAYLNGVSIPYLLRILTFGAKTLGVIFSVSAGLPVGKEGPMIHAGAVHGAFFSQGVSSSLRFKVPAWLDFFKSFRNDASKRDFVAGGAAAGVAAAFGAPIGGVLFAIEEGCSFIDVPVLLQTLLASMTSYLTLNVAKSLLLNTHGELSSGGLINFGYFKNPSYNMLELVIFALMGVFGGLMGAMWNSLNARLTRYRMRFIQTKGNKLFEVILVTGFVTLTSFSTMISISDCRYIDSNQDIGNNGDHIIRMNCPTGMYSADAAICEFS